MGDDELMYLAAPDKDKKDDKDCCEREGRNNKPKDPLTIYFDDGVRRIDFILVFEKKTGDIRSTTKRMYFENKLKSHGIDLELETLNIRHSILSVVKSEQKSFMKCHAKFETIATYCEKRSIKLPLQIQKPTGQLTRLNFKRGQVKMAPVNDTTPLPPPVTYDAVEACTDFLEGPYKYNPGLDPFSEMFVCCPYRVDKHNKFANCDDREDFFPQYIRIAAVWEILQRARYSDASGDSGIFNLLRDDVYSAAYPLHDGTTAADAKKSNAPVSIRKLLFEEWAQFHVFYKRQPIPLIREYFGEKVTLYFAFCGFYTTALFYAGIAGMVVFAASFVYPTFTSQVADEVCFNDSWYQYRYSCPECPTCPFRVLKDVYCSSKNIDAIFNTEINAIYAIFLVIWAQCFLSLWKRKQLKLAHSWGCHNILQDEPIPGYYRGATDFILDPITENWRPFRPRDFKVAVNYKVTLIFIPLILLALTVLLMVILVRSAIFGYLVGRKGIFHASNFTTIAGYIIEKIILDYILAPFYKNCATKLSYMERWPTIREHEDSIIMKFCTLTFINHYGTFFYIAFLKPLVSAYPNDRTFIFGMLLEYCPSGCGHEICFSLIVSNVLEDFLNNIIEATVPRLRTSVKMSFLDKDSEEAKKLKQKQKLETKKRLNRIEEDYYLDESDPFWETDVYRALAVRFGQTVFFASSFPLATVFAFINNVLETRIDAYKFLVQSRRQIPHRARNIGPWMNIFETLLTLAILTNSIYLAVTTEVVDMFHFYYSKGDYTIRGYFKNVLTSFNTSTYNNQSRPETYDPSNYLTRECWYLDRQSHNDAGDNLELLTFRLLVLCIFQNILASVCALTDRILSENTEMMGGKISSQSQFEKSFFNEAEET